MINLLLANKPFVNSIDQTAIGRGTKIGIDTGLKSHYTGFLTTFCHMVVVPHNIDAIEVAYNKATEPPFASKKVGKQSLAACAWDTIESVI